VSLFDPDQHEPLTDTAWDEARAAEAVARIVATAAAPDDDLSLWTGKAGVLWALDRLGAEVETSLPPRDELPSGLMTGETGILLVSWRLGPTEAKAARLFGLVEQNAGNPSHELFDGSPGTMLAALHAYEATGDERWAELWRRCADLLWEQFRPDPELGCRIWIQYRRGRLLRSIGAGHGFASNVRSLLRGRALLDEARVAELERAAAETATRLAMREDGLVNWPTAADRYWAEQFATRVQWCHGAPGLVTSLAELPRDEETDELLSAAGELTWRAGPLRKGAGLCHGTAGNGCAFLALHARTGESLWLDRARAFAMHALEQDERTDAGDSLWNGCLGVALYLRACVEGWHGMPIIDVL
jgi:lantibiotic modifying enzyme